MPADASRLDASRLDAALRDLRAAADALPSALATHLASLDAALAAARTEADRLRADLGRERDRALQAETAADENGRAADAAERALAAARAEAARLRTDLDAAHADVARRRAAAAHRGALPHDALAARPKAPRARPVPAAPPEPGVPAPSPAQAGPPAAGSESRLAETFRAWCGAATPVMGKVEFFAGFARTALPDASVVAVYRDANSQATPVALSARGGASPVEHWLVALGGRHWLLPQPLTAAQFRELGPCFEGHATPTALVTIAPAEVRVVGDRYEIARPGHVA